MEGLSKNIKILFLLISIFANCALTRFMSASLNVLRFQNCNEADLNNIRNVQTVAEFYADACCFTTLKSNTFVHFTALSVLEITNSLVETLESSTLHGLRGLRTLSLAGNNISSIKCWPSNALIALKTLDLRSNKIVVLQNDSFDCYPSLQSLDLSENLLHTLNGNEFVKLKYLRHLNISKNQLIHLSGRAFEGLERLSHLKLSHNKIYKIDETTFHSNPHLRALNLQFNKIKDLKFFKASTTRLHYLDLTNNLISEIASNVFEHNSELISLDLSWNLLTKLEDNSLKGLHSLENLSLSHNLIKNITSQSLGELGVLKHLSLSHNNISSIPDQLFHATPLLERIDLAQNKLTTFGETLFSQLAFLTNLNLSGNKLRNATFTAHFAAALHQSKLSLELRDNQLQHSTLDTRKLAEFERVELAGNHFNCLWLITELTSLPTSVRFGREYEAPIDARSDDLLNMTGFDCYDEHRKRSIIILQSSCNQNSTQKKDNIPKVKSSNETLKPENPSLPPLVWPKIRVDKFDSRSVIIWMLIAIAVAFAGLRVAKHLEDEKERKKLCQKLKQQRSNIADTETLISQQANVPRDFLQGQRRREEKHLSNNS